MAVEFGSNFITGITTATSDTDVAYKEYADNKPGYALTATPTPGQFYKGDIDVETTTVGLSTTFVYDTPGSYTYPVDSSATSLSVYITGSGGGGSESTSDTTGSLVGFSWSSVCNPLSIWSYGCQLFASNDTTVIASSWNSRGILTSDDAINWTKRTIGTNKVACSLTYANNLFMYGGCYDGEILTSTDAINWTMRTSACGCGAIIGLAYANNLWFADGTCCSAQSSTDAIHWTLRTIPFANCCGCRNTSVFGAGLFLNAGYSSVLRVSTDTIHWSFRTAATSSTCKTWNTKFIANEFLVVGCGNGNPGQIQKSTDTIHWVTGSCGNLDSSRLTATAPGSSFITDITKIVNDSMYLVTGGTCSVLSTSTDFTNWTSQCVKDTALYNCACEWNYCWMSLHKLNLSAYPNRYVMGGVYYNSLAVAEPVVAGKNGVGGAASGSFLYDISLENVSKKEGLSVCVGSGGKGGGNSWNASNCSNWTQRTAVGNSCHVFDMAYNQGKFVAVGCGKLLTTSTDAIHWFRRTIGDVQSATSLTSVIYDYQYWLVTGCGTSNLSYGSLSASTDSIHWTQRTTGMTDDHSSIIYNDKKGTYLLNSKGCSIASSTDSIHWTQRTVGSTNIQFARFIGYGLDYYIASGGQYFSSSTDAIHWKQRTVGNGGGTGNAASKYAFAYLHPNYVLSLGTSSPSTSSLISASTDSIHWTTRTGNSGMDHFVGTGTKMNSINGEIYRHNGINCATYSTTDTIHWACKPLPTGGGFGYNFSAFAYGGGQFVRSYSCDSSGFCMSSFDASSSSGCNTTVSWYDGFPANAKGCVYPLDITSVGGTPPTSASASYCFNPIGSGAAVLEYNSSDFRLSSTNTTAAGDFTVEFWFRIKQDAGNPGLQTLFALGEPNENGFFAVKHDGTYMCYYYKTTGGASVGVLLAPAAQSTWHHAGVGYKASCQVFSHFLNGTTVGQYGASSAIPSVYGDRLRIGSLYDTNYSLTSLVDQGAFNGEITNFRISNNLRYTSDPYTVPTPDFTLDSNTVFLTGRGESLNGSSGSQTCINIPGGAGATVFGPGLGYEYTGLKQTMYSNIATGKNCRSIGHTATGASGNCDYRNGEDSKDNYTCCSRGASTGGAVGALSKDGNAVGGEGQPITMGQSKLIGVSNNKTGIGRGGSGGDAILFQTPGKFTSRTAQSGGLYGAAFLNGYYMANNYASTDTITWELRTVPTIWQNYSYGGYMMAYDETNPTEVIMYTSCCQLYHTTDSIHWKMRTTPFGHNGPLYSCSVQDVRYMSNSEWSVSGCKLISISTDTIHWFLRTAGGCSGGNPIIKGVVYGNNKYMAAGHCCQYIATSTDSIAWTLRTRATSNFNADSNPYNPAFGDGMFIVTAYRSVSYSTDAIHWKACYFNQNDTHYIHGMRYNNYINQFISSSYYDYIIMSRDGVNWSANAAIPITSSSQNQASYGYFAGFVKDKFLYSNGCTGKGFGCLMTADSNQGSFSGCKGETGAGGGGGSYIVPTRESQTGGDGGDAYVRINWK